MTRDFASVPVLHYVNFCEVRGMCLATEKTENIGNGVDIKRHLVLDFAHKGLAVRCQASVVDYKNLARAMAAYSNTSDKLPPKKELWESMLPELLTEEQLIAGLAQKNISGDGMDKPHLVELFKRMVMPLPQRRVWQSKAKKHTDTLAHVQRSLSSPPTGTAQVNGTNANNSRTNKITDTAKLDPSIVKVVRNGLVDKMKRLSPAESEPSPKRSRQEITWP